ncbi:MAG TPA: hypothetical protein VMT17_15535 [Anaeromyxobacteraceae bacterium]|nr:hypothetical protein [Anaeromyxobacteraceae bacterium]
MHPTHLARVAAAFLAGVALASCSRNYSSDFPLSEGFSMLEPCLAQPPSPTATDTYPEMLGPQLTGEANGHLWAHGRAYIHVPIAKVYQALYDPYASYIHGPEVGVSPGGEPFPISFRITYTVRSIITVQWTIEYRGGVIGGTEADPTDIGMRYHEIWPNNYVQLQDGSLEATPVDGAPDVTEVAFVCWLDAHGQGQSDVWGTVNDWFNDLTAKSHAIP